MRFAKDKWTLYAKEALSFLLLFLMLPPVLADDSTAVEKLSIFGKKEALPTRPGSAHVLSPEELKQYEYTDIHQVLRSVPGVNIQEEDGFGLRPNIGLRGGHPHRSRKVTLMEDGVLIGPAPYSAPAAYYFPQMSKLESIEVFKGTPATRFGPNSIGGAINMVTGAQPQGVKLASGGGNFGLQKYDLMAGLESYGDFSLVVNRLENQGFKELANKEDTGFERNNVSFRWEKYYAKWDQNLIFKFNWADEKSNETYGGLTDFDFERNPNLRYPSTEFDEMSWTHQQYFLSYALSPSSSTRFRTTVYNHNFKRSWNKLNGFGGTNINNPSAAIRDVYEDPLSLANNYYYLVLSGLADSGVLDDNRDVLDVGNNQRQYYSRGAQLHFDYDLEGTEWSHLFQWSYRYHQDGISRFHESRYYDMVSGRMRLSSARAQETTVLNESLAEAHTAAFNYELGIDSWNFNTVFRVEDIDYEQTNFQTSETQESGDEIFAPGFGVFYEAFNNGGFLAGVNKAFTPVGPGQDDSVSPEEAINYELGVRYSGEWGAELIGFYSDYENILGTCTQSAGCPISFLDQRFNGGEASVLGFETLAKGAFHSGNHSFPVQWTLTYSKAQFDNQFTAAINEWGIGAINPGDPIPYIPEWQSHLNLGWKWKAYSVFYNINYLGEMADQAVATGRRYIPARTVMGLSAQYHLSAWTKILFRVDNLMNEEYAVSRRPFGLRPGMPRTFFLGGEIAFR